MSLLIDSINMQNQDDSLSPDLVEVLADFHQANLEVQKFCKQEQESVVERVATLKQRKKKFSTSIGAVAGELTKLIKLNIGGDTNFVVRRDTLLRLPSRLSQMFSGRWEKQLPRDSEGRFFLDFNPQHMRAIFTWLAEAKRYNNDGPRLPHPREKLPTEKAWGFDELLEYLQLEEHGAQSSSSSIIEEKLLSAVKAMLPQTAELQLLYRASRDGFGATEFHRLCDRQGATVVIAKSCGGYIFGGFTEKPWDANLNGYCDCTQSFLFRLAGPEVSAPSKHPMYQNHCNGIYCHTSCGPTFGGGHDMQIQSGTGQSSKVSFNVGHTYNKAGEGASLNTLAESSSVSVTDYEVFRVD